MATYLSTLKNSKETNKARGEGRNMEKEKNSMKKVAGCQIL